MRIKNKDIKMAYSMEDGPAGSSYALGLARSMNLGRDELLEKARQIKERK